MAIGTKPALTNSITYLLLPIINGQKNGDLVLKGKKVTGFSNSEEAAVQLTKVVPFLLEDELKMKVKF